MLCAIHEIQYDRYCSKCAFGDSPPDYRTLYEQAQQEKAELVEALEDAERVLEWGEPEPKPVLARVRSQLAKHRPDAGED